MHKLLDQCLVINYVLNRLFCLPSAWVLFDGIAVEVMVNDLRIDNQCILYSILTTFQLFAELL